VESFAAVRSVLLYTLLLNLLVSAAKIAVGYATGSLSILAGGFDSLFDGLTNVIGLIAIYLSRQPPDEDHPYGHRRYETLMTLAVSALLFVTCYNLLRGAYERLLNPAVPEVNFWSFASLLLSIAVQFFTGTYELRRGRELKSEFLIADASHTRADVLVTLGVLGGLVVVKMGYPMADTIVAVAIAFVITRMGIDIIRSSTRILIDTAVLDAARVAAILQQVPGVESYHHIRSRGQEDDIHLDLHIRVAPQMPSAEAHLIAHEVQRRLQRAIEGVRDVVVHVEPQPGVTTWRGGDLDLSAKVKEAAGEAGATIHHLNVYATGDGRCSVDLHVEVPDGLTLGEAHAQASVLEDRIKASIPEVAEISTHIEPAVAPYAECDRLLEDSQIEQTVRQLTRNVPGVRDCHDVKLLRAEGKLFLSVHCALDEHLPITQAHDIATRLEEHLKRECSGVERVFVHVEPATKDAPSAQAE
jgi:cation diffusion facilitator family transporter